MSVGLLNYIVLDSLIPHAQTCTPFPSILEVGADGNKTSVK